MKKRILVVEDDAAIRTGVRDSLRFAGYEVDEAGDGDAGMNLALSVDCDLVLLDLVLPGPDGLTILRRVRQLRPSLPIIMLTARGEEQDRVAGLKSGADDYVVKPFGVSELLARVEAVLRRTPTRPAEATNIKLAGAEIDFSKGEVAFPDGARTTLSDKEGELLRYLVGSVGRAVSRDELLSRVWGLDPQGLATRTVDMHIARLREKLRDDPDAPKLVITVRGKGYMLAAEAAS
jgi:two-component system alkaline phosphatase synthesis response regulator PhoP